MCDYAAASRGKQAAGSHSPLAISQPNHQEPRTEKQSSTQLPEWSPLSINTTKQWTSAIVRLCSSKQGQQQHGQSCSDRSKQRQAGPAATRSVLQRHKQSATQVGTISDRAHRPAATHTANLASNLAATEHIEQRQSPASSGANGEASSANAYKYSEDLKRCGCLLADQIS